MKGININFVEEIIVMNSAFAKKAKQANSPEYKELIKVRKEFPTYQLKTRTIKRNANKECYKGLTYDYMKEYITAHPRAKENMIIFEEMIFQSKAHTIKYPTIKKWFFKTYPEFAEYGAADNAIKNEYNTAA